MKKSVCGKKWWGILFHLWSDEKGVWCAFPPSSESTICGVPSLPLMKVLCVVCLPSLLWKYNVWCAFPPSYESTMCGVPSLPLIKVLCKCRFNKTLFSQQKYKKCLIVFFFSRKLRGYWRKQVYLRKQSKEIVKMFKLKDTVNVISRVTQLQFPIYNGTLKSLSQ